MRFKSTKIKFDGQTPKEALGSPSYNGDIWFATTENSMYKEEFAGQPEIIETSVPGRDQPYFHRVDHAPLEFNMVLAFEDSITEEQLKQLYLWLYKPDYRELKFGADYEGDTFQEKSFYVIFNNQPKITYVFDEEENIKGYIKLHARCNSSTGFIKKIHDTDADGYVYSGSHDGTVRKIDSDRNQVWEFTGHSSWVLGVAVDSDGYVYSVAGDNTVRKIDPNGNQVWSFTGHSDDVNGVAVDIDGYVYTGSYDNTLRKIDPDGNEVWSFKGHSGNVNGVAVDVDGYVYSASSDDTVRKIDTNGDELWSFTGHSGIVEAVAVDADGYVYSGSRDDTVRKIKSDGNQVWSFTGNGGDVYDVAVDADGYVYGGFSDKTVRKINPEGNQVWSFTEHSDRVDSVAVDADGYVYSGSYDNTVRKIDSDGNQVWSFTGHSSSVYGLAVYNLIDNIIKINNEDGVEPILYEINVESVEAGNIKIGDILIQNVSKGEKITINNNTKVITTDTQNKNIYKDWNKKWISVRPGEEKIISMSNIAGKIITYKPVFM